MHKKTHICEKWKRSLTGNMMFRDWEDSCKKNNTLSLNLPSTIGENKMSDRLNRLVAEKVIAQLNEQGVEIDEGFPVDLW